MAAITLNQLTTGSVDGTGVFDDLMRTVQAQLEQEFREGRISGNDYGQVYVQAMSAVMQQAVAFLMGNQQADKQAELLAAQTANELKQGLLLDEQILKIQAETALIQQQTVNAVTQNVSMVKEQAKTDAEVALLGQQLTNAVTQNDTMLKQQAKLDAETDLLVQKKITEEAQTTGTDVSIGGVLGKQMLLYTKQADGFDRDAEQKAARIFTDVYGVDRSSDPDSTTTPPSMNNAEVDKVITVLKTGIGVS